MIEYYGRGMPCFLVRSGACDTRAAYRFENEHLVLHLCEQHKNHFGQGSLTPLKEEGEGPDRFDAIPLNEFPRILRELEEDTP